MNVKFLWFPVLIIFSLIVFFSLIKPQWKEYTENKKEIKKLEESRKIIENNAASLQKVFEEFNNLDDESKDMIFGAIPMDETSDDLVAELNKNAVRSGVYISNIDLKKQAVRRSSCENDKKKNKKDVSCPAQKMKLTVELQVNGTYEEVKKFIGLLDTQNRIISFSSIDFSKVETAKQKVVLDEEGNEKVVENKSNSIDLRISFNVFYRFNDENISLSKLTESDPIIKSLFKGEIKTEVIRQVKSAIDNDLFIPVVAGQSGKSNIFQ